MRQEPPESAASSASTWSAAELDLGYLSEGLLYEMFPDAALVRTQLEKMQGDVRRAFEVLLELTNSKDTAMQEDEDYADYDYAGPSRPTDVPFWAYELGDEGTEYAGAGDGEEDWEEDWEEEEEEEEEEEGEEDDAEFWTKSLPEPVCQPLHALVQARGHSCHGVCVVRVQCKLWVFLGTLPLITATIKRLQERTKTAQKPLGFIGNGKTNPGRQVLCLQLSFSRGLWAVWVGAPGDGSLVFAH